MSKSHGVSVRCNLCGEHGISWRNLSPQEVRLLDALGAEVTSVTDWNLAMVTFRSTRADAPGEEAGR